MFKHTLMKLVLVSIGLSYSMLFAEKASSQKKHHSKKKKSKHDKNHDHEDHTRCSCSRKKKREMSKETTTQLRGPEDDRTVQKTPLSSSSFQSLVIAGSSKVGNDLTVGDDLVVQQNISTQDLSLKEDLRVGGNNICGQPGFLSVQGDGKFNDGLRIGKETTAHIVNVDILTAQKESCGTLTVSGSENIGSVTVAANAQVGGTVFTNRIDPLNDQTITFENNVSIADSKKLLVNEIDPVTCSRAARFDEGNDSSKNSSNVPQCGDLCPIVCSEDDSRIIQMSGNVAVHPDKTLLVNDIDPVTKDREGHYIDNTQNDAFTSFSGNVAIPKILLANEINPLLNDCTEQPESLTIFSGNAGVNPSKTLYANTIIPTEAIFGGDQDFEYDYFYGPDYLDFFSMECPFTTFSGGVSIKNHHIFGQLDYRGIDKSTNQTIPLELDDLPLGSNGLNYPTTECAPVLRLNFTNTREDFNNNSSSLSYGAWVKLDITGLAEINFRGEKKDSTLVFDVFTELYFFVGPGNGSHSAFVGTLNGANFSNTLSGNLCDTKTANPFRAINRSLRACIPPSQLAKISQGSLFGIVPTALNALSAPAIIGTPVTSSAQPHAVDILLMGLLPFNDTTEFNFDQDDYPYNYHLHEILDPVCPFSLKNLTVYYEVISPNIQTVCFPDPQNLFDQSIYDQACSDLITTFSTCGYLAPYDEIDN